MGSVVVVHRLSCHRHVESSGPRVKPISLALAGRFLTTEPPGKSWIRVNPGGYWDEMYVFCMQEGRDWRGQGQWWNFKD